jgi:hypothetical protein
VRRVVTLAGVLAAGALWFAPASVAQGPGRLRGFSARAGAAEAARERELKAMPSAKAAEADFDVMTSEQARIVIRALQRATRTLWP